MHNLESTMQNTLVPMLAKTILSEVIMCLKTNCYFGKSSSDFHFQNVAVIEYVGNVIVWREGCLCCAVHKAFHVADPRDTEPVSKGEVIFFLFFFGCPMAWKFPGQGSDLSHSCGNAGSFTLLCWARDGIYDLALWRHDQSCCATVDTPRGSYFQQNCVLREQLHQ